MRSPPRIADSCAHTPVIVQFAAVAASTDGAALVADGAHELVHEMRMRAAMSAALDERRVLVLLVVHARPA